MRMGRLGIAIVAAGGLVWAMWTDPPPRPLYELRPPATVRTDLGEVHDPKACGTIVGRVLWDGPVPAVAPLDLPVSTLIPSRTRTVPNPNAPRVKDGRVADAIVWLRGIDPTRSRPWDHPAVTVEAMELAYRTRQGEERVRTGFVRRGEAVQFTTREPERHSIRGRGAAFFTDFLFKADQPTSRTLTDEGVVELTSATGVYWARSHLVVSDHPYLTRTNEAGEFRLTAVPAGSYDLVCWMPNWRIHRLERDPELVVHVRMVFGPDVESKRSIRVTAGQTEELDFRVAENDFK
jgi:hypothetical protein